MDRYVFYQTNKSVGIVNSADRSEHIYNNDTKPIRAVVSDVSQQAIDLLMDIYTQDIEQFIDIIQNELNENFLTSYFN